MVGSASEIIKPFDVLFLKRLMFLKSSLDEETPIIATTGGGGGGASRPANTQQSKRPLEIWSRIGSERESFSRGAIPNHRSKAQSELRVRATTQLSSTREIKSLADRSYMKAQDKILSTEDLTKYGFNEPKTMLHHLN